MKFLKNLSQSENKFKRSLGIFISTILTIVVVSGLFMLPILIPTNLASTLMNKNNWQYWLLISILIALIIPIGSLYYTFKVFRNSRNKKKITAPLVFFAVSLLLYSPITVPSLKSILNSKNELSEYQGPCLLDKDRIRRGPDSFEIIINMNNETKKIAIGSDTYYDLKSSNQLEDGNYKCKKEIDVVYLDTLKSVIDIKY